MSDPQDKELEYEQLTGLVAGEIDRQLKHRSDVLDTMKSQMSKVLKEFEELTCNVQAKRSWMKSVGKTREIMLTSPSAVAIHPIVTTGNIALGAAPSPSKLPKLSGLKARKKLQQQLNRNISGTLPSTDGVSSDARNQDGKISFDKKLPRVANIERRTDGMQSMIAMQQKQMMYEKASARYPQCRSNIFAPSVYDSSESSWLSQAPQPVPRTTLELEFVYGVNNGTSSTSTITQSSAVSSSTTNISGNVHCLNTGEIMWFTASLVVLYSRETNTQRYFQEHTNQVTSITLHPNQHIVASGQVGRETFVLVWDANDDPLGKRFACLKGHTVSVRSISFSHDGKLIASLGGDMYNTICIHDWRDQTLLVSARGHSFRVHTIAFNPFQAYGRPETKRSKRPGQALQDDEVCYTLVSCGVRHIRFWTLTKTEYSPPLHEESEQSAFYGSSFGSPNRLRPPTPHEKVWKLEGNVPSFHGRLDVQDFTSLAFVDDSPPLYVYDESRKELVATNSNDHTLGRVIASTAKGDLCVFWQPRKAPEVEDLSEQNHNKEPAKWWEIPDEYTDADINELVLEKIAYEPSGRLVELVPHDVETGNRFKISKQAQLEIDNIHKRLQLKPNSASLHSRLTELKYSGPIGHQGCIYQLAHCKKNNCIMSAGVDGKLILWECRMPQPVRIPGINTRGVFTPLKGSYYEGSHDLRPVDYNSRVFHLPTHIPDDPLIGGSPNGQPKPTSICWNEDGKCLIVTTSANCIWELCVESGEWKLVFETRSGYMATCSCHPAKEEVVTVSFDLYVTVWDLRRHVCSRRAFIGGDRSAQLPSSGKPVCMEFHPFGDEIAIGMSNGELVIISYNDLRILKRKFIKPHLSASVGNNETTQPGSVVAATQVKYDPDGKTLAVGAKDTFIYIYDVGAGYKKIQVCEGHSTPVCHLTWSVDGDILQSNAVDGEVLFWNRSSGAIKQVADAFTVRDTAWAEWTCVFGWPIPGIWPPDSTNLVDIAAVATSGVKVSSPLVSENEAEDIVAVANRNTLRLFCWPTPRGSRGKSYHAHSALISSVCFSFNNRYVVTTGGEDGTLMQWRCIATSGDPKSPRVNVQKRKQQFRLAMLEENSEISGDPKGGPVPPSNNGRHGNGQLSPRQMSRQYRERNPESEETQNEEGSPSPRPPAPRPTSVQHAQCRAKHDFTPEHDDELRLTAGELIRIMSKEGGEWWLGESCDGTRGIFPSNFVEEVAVPIEATNATNEDNESIAHQEVQRGEVDVQPPSEPAGEVEDDASSSTALDAFSSSSQPAEDNGM